MQARRKTFLRKWRLKCRAVADSLAEAGYRLFAFTRLGPSQWKSARTTNAIERLNEELRRRIKTQTVLPCDETVPMPHWALLASGRSKCGTSTDGKPLPNPSSRSPLTSPLERPQHQMPGGRRRRIATRSETRPCACRGSAALHQALYLMRPALAAQADGGNGGEINPRVVFSAP